VRERAISRQALLLGRLGGLGLVFLVARTDARHGAGGPGLQVDVQVVGVAHDVLVIAEGRHDLFLARLRVALSAGEDADELLVADRLQRVLQRRGVGRTHGVGAVTDMALGVIATVTGVGVPVELLAVVGDVEGRVTFGVLIFSVLNLHGCELVDQLGILLGRVRIELIGQGRISLLRILGLDGEGRDGRKGDGRHERTDGGFADDMQRRFSQELHVG